MMITEEKNLTGRSLNGLKPEQKKVYLIYELKVCLQFGTYSTSHHVIL